MIKFQTAMIRLLILLIQMSLKTLKQGEQRKRKKNSGKSLEKSHVFK